MANEIKLELYTFRIREKHRTDYLLLDNFFGEQDFFAFFQEYISSFDKNMLVNEQQKKSLQFITEFTSIASDKRTISGIIESGDYGVESRIVNKNSKKEKYRKEVDDIDIKPFYFLILAGKGHDKGLLILQRLGGFGINSIFTNHFELFFKQKKEGLILEFSPFVSRQLAKQFLDNGAIKEFTLRRYNLPPDIASKLGFLNHTEEILSVELKITAKKKNKLSLNNKVKKFIKDPNAKLFDLKELESIGFDGEHKSLMKVKLGNNTRTIDLSETLQIRPYYDIDSYVEKENSGHPQFKSIDKIAKELVSDIINEFYN